jgi:hypothetical protein
MRYSSITVLPTHFRGANLKEGQSYVKRYRNRGGLKKLLVGQMLADVDVWLIRSKRALGSYHDGNKSLWCASKLGEKCECMLCAPGDLIELRLKPNIPSDDSAARWLTRFGHPKPPLRFPLHYPRSTVMYVRNTASVATIRQTQPFRQGYRTTSGTSG